MIVKYSSKYKDDIGIWYKGFDKDKIVIIDDKLYYKEIISRYVYFHEGEYHMRLLVIYIEKDEYDEFSKEYDDHIDTQLKELEIKDYVEY